MINGVPIMVYSCVPIGTWSFQFDDFGSMAVYQFMGLLWNFFHHFLSVFSKCLQLIFYAFKVAYTRRPKIPQDKDLLHLRMGVVWTFFHSSIILFFFLPLSGRRPDID